MSDARSPSPAPVEPDRLQKTLEKTAETIRTLRQENRDLRKSVERLEKQAADQESKLGQSSAESADAKQNLRILTNDNARLQRRLNTAENNLTDLREKRRELERHGQTLERTIAQLEAEKEKMQDGVADLFVSLHRLESENTRLAQRLAECDQQVRDSAHLRDRLTLLEAERMLVAENLKILLDQLNE
jgi:chromosome segregation ATPase